MGVNLVQKSRSGGYVVHPLELRSDDVASFQGRNGLLTNQTLRLESYRKQNFPIDDSVQQLLEIKSPLLFSTLLKGRTSREPQFLQLLGLLQGQEKDAWWLVVTETVEKEIELEFGDVLHGAQQFQHLWPERPLASVEELFDLSEAEMASVLSALNVEVLR